MQKNKVVATSGTSDRLNHLGTVIFRSRQTGTNSGKKLSSKSIKLVDHTPRYSIEECIHRLTLLISRNVPLPKSFAHQVKNYLLIQSLGKYEEEYCITRQKTEDGLSPLKENLYLNSIISTDLPSTSWYKEEAPTMKVLKKRSLASRKGSGNDFQDTKETIANLETQLENLKTELLLRQSTLSDLKTQLDCKIQKEKQAQDLLTKALIQKIDDDNNLKNAIQSNKEELTKVRLQLEVLGSLLKEREAEIFYFWQAQLKLQ